MYLAALDAGTNLGRLGSAMHARVRVILKPLIAAVKGQPGINTAMLMTGVLGAGQGGAHLRLSTRGRNGLIGTEDEKATQLEELKPETLKTVMGWQDAVAAELARWSEGEVGNPEVTEPNLESTIHRTIMISRKGRDVMRVILTSGTIGSTIDHDIRVTMLNHY